MDEDFRTHLEHVTAARAELGIRMRALQDALALPLGLPVWGRRVRAALTGVGARPAGARRASRSRRAGFTPTSVPPRRAWPPEWTPNWLTTCSSGRRSGSAPGAGRRHTEGGVGSTPRGS